MAITKKRIKPNYHDKKLIVEDVSQAQLPDDTYNITIRDAFIDTLADIRTLKPATWARINHSPSKTMFHLSNEPNVNTHDISSIRTLCLTKPEYSHFLLPRALRTKFTEDTGSIFTTVSGSTFEYMITEDSNLKIFDDALDVDLREKITTMAYKKVAKGRLTSISAKTAKELEYQVLLSGIQES